MSPRASHSHSLACALGTRQLLIMMFLARCVYPAARAAALYQVNCADKRCCFVSAGGQDSYSARQVRAFHQGERRFRAGDADVTIEVQARPYLVFLVVMPAVFLSMNSRDLIIVQGQAGVLLLQHAQCPAGLLQHNLGRCSSTAIPAGCAGGGCSYSRGVGRTCRAHLPCPVFGSEQVHMLPLRRTLNIGTQMPLPQGHRGHGQCQRTLPQEPPEAVCKRVALCRLDMNIGK